MADRSLKLVRSDEQGASGGQPPYDDDMTSQRLDRLETFADTAKDRLARMETKLDHIDREVSTVKWWIIAQIAAGVFTVLGTGVAIQQMTVATFQGAAQVAKDSASAAPVPSQQPIIINVPAQPTAAAGPK